MSFVRALPSGVSSLALVTLERKQKLVSEGVAAHTERNLLVRAECGVFELETCCQAGLPV
jgi:hypothetical protein